MLQHSKLLTSVLYFKAALLISFFLLNQVHAASLTIDAFDSVDGDGKCSLQEAVLRSSNLVEVRNTEADIDSNASAIEGRETLIVDKANAIIVEAAQVDATSVGLICGSLNAAGELTNAEGSSQSVTAAFFDGLGAAISATVTERALTEEALSGTDDDALCLIWNQLLVQKDALEQRLEELNQAPNDCPRLDGRSDRLSLENGTHTVTQELRVLSRLSISPVGSDDLESEVDIVIQGDGSSRIFIVDIDSVSSEKTKGSLNINSATLIGGDAGATSTTTVTDGLGGAIYCQGSLDLVDVNIEQSSAVDGGGAYVASQCNFSSDNVNYMNNAAERNGGALYLSSNTASPFRGEMYSNTAGNDGGAMYISTGRLELDVHRIGDAGKGNSAGRNGGAIAVAAINSNTQLNIQRTSIADNNAAESGGGISILPNDKPYYAFSRQTIASQTITTETVTSTGTMTTFSTTKIDDYDAIETTDTASYQPGQSIVITPDEIERVVVLVDFDEDTTVVTTVNTSTVTSPTVSVQNSQTVTVTVTTEYYFNQTVNITVEIGTLPNDIFPSDNSFVNAVFENVTFANNASGVNGGALSSDIRGSRLLNNVTVMENSAGENGAGLYLKRLNTFQSSTPENGGNISVASGLLLANTVVAFNEGASNCAIEAPEGTSTVTHTRSYRLFSNDNSCLGEEASFNQITTSSAPTEFFALRGGSTYDSRFGGYVPIADNSLSIRAYDKGASQTDEFPCKKVDMRIDDVESGFNSVFRYELDNFICDIGATEHQRAQATEDEYLDVPNDSKICLNVLNNDVKDGQFSPDQGDFLALGDTTTISSVVTSRSGRAEVVMFCDADGDNISDLVDQDLNNDGEFTPCVDVDPEDGIPDEECDTLGVLYTPPQSNILQRDSFEYVVRVDGNGETVTEVSIFTGPPRNGFANYSCGGILSDNCAGSFSFIWLGLLGLFAVFGRMLRATVLEVSVSKVGASKIRQARFAFLVTLMGLMVAVNSNALEITVNSCSDNAFDPVTQELNDAALNDGFCTLREAVLAAKNNDGILYQHNDCTAGNTGRDQIILDIPTQASDKAYAACSETTGTMTVQIDGTLVTNSLIDIICRRSDDEGDDEEEDYNQRTETPLCSIVRDSEDSNKFSLLKVESSLFVSGVTFENGSTVGNGGAILADRSVILENVEFHDNNAKSGGAIFLQGDRANLSVVGALFEGNQAVNNDNTNAGGGAIASATNIESEIIVDSVSFFNNSAAGSDSRTYGGALFLRTIDNIEIKNSTFSGNAAPNGGAIDVSGALAEVDLRNLTIIGNAATVAGGAISGLADISAGIKNSIFASNSPQSCDSDSGRRLNNRYDEESCEIFPDTETVTIETVTVTSTSPTTTTGTITTSTVVATNPVELEANLADYFTLEESTTRPWPFFTVSVGSEQRYSEIIENQIPNDLDEDNLCASLDNQKGIYVDQFGVDRSSGGACDVGAIEQIRLTANNDGGEIVSRADNLYRNPLTCRFLNDDLGVDSAAHENYSSKQRVVLIDIYGNDILTGTSSPADTETLSVIINESEGEISYLDQVVDVAQLESYLITQLEEDEVTSSSQQSELIDCITERKEAFPDKVVLFDGTGLKVGTYAFTYELIDTDGVPQDTAQVTVTLKNTNPIARDDTLRMPIGAASKAINVFVNDLDPDGASAPGVNDSQIFDISSQCLPGNVIITNDSNNIKLDLLLESIQTDSTLTITRNSFIEEEFVTGSTTEIVVTTHFTNVVTNVRVEKVTAGIISEDGVNIIPSTPEVFNTGTVTRIRTGTTTVSALSTQTSTILQTSSTTIDKTVPKLEVVNQPSLGGVFINDNCQIEYFPSRLVNGVATQVSNTEFTYKVYDNEYYVEDADADAFIGESNEATVFVKMVGPGSEDSEQDEQLVSFARGIGTGGAINPPLIIVLVLINLFRLKKKEINR